MPGLGEETLGCPGHTGAVSLKGSGESTVIRLPRLRGTTMARH